MEGSGATTTVTIFDLPFEDIVLNHIVKHLDMSDLVNLRCCSRAFQGLAERICEEKKSLIIKCVSDKRSHNVMNSMAFCMAVQNCQRLRVIRLENLPKISKGKLAALITNNPRIKEFIITCREGCCIHVEGLYPLTQCKDLIHLEIRRAKLQNSFLKEFATNNILLQRIHIRSVFGFTGKVFAAFFAKQYNLLKITLHTLRVFLHPSLMAIGGSCQQLEEIDVRDCKQVTDTGIMSIAKKCPKIHTILFSSYDDPIDPNLPLSFRPFYRRADVSSRTLDYLKSRNITTHKKNLIPAHLDDSSDVSYDSDDNWPNNMSDDTSIVSDSDDSDNGHSDDTSIVSDSDNGHSDDELDAYAAYAAYDYTRRCHVQ